MGAFFTNVHIKIAGDDTARRVRDAIEEAVAADGFVPARGADVVERTVLIAKPASEWLVVYDQSSDAMDVKTLESLGRAASRGSFAVTALVYDSDDLVLTLFNNGVRKD